MDVNAKSSVQGLAESTQRVHLALVITCVAALALGLQGARYIPEAAKKELAMIAPTAISEEERARTLWEKLSAKVTLPTANNEDNGSYGLFPHYRFHVYNHPFRRPSSSSLRVDGGDLIFFADSLNWAFFSNAHRRALKQGVSRECVVWSPIEEGETVRGDLYEFEWVATRSVFNWNSLRSFQFWWDADNVVVPISVPVKGEVQLDDKSFAYEIVKNPPDKEKDSDWTRDQAQLRLSLEQSVVPIPGAYGVRLGNYRLEGRGSALRVRACASISANIVAAARAIEFPLSSAEIMLDKRVDFRNWLGEELKVPKTSGAYASFARTFPALAAAAAGWEDRSIDELRTYFSGSAPSDRAFEALGVKVSIESAASAACFAVVCFQVALLGFIRELRIRLVGIPRGDWPADYTLLFRDKVSASVTKWLILALPPASVLTVFWNVSNGVFSPAGVLLGAIFLVSLAIAIWALREATGVLTSTA